MRNAKLFCKFIGFKTGKATKLQVTQDPWSIANRDNVKLVEEGGSVKIGKFFGRDDLYNLALQTVMCEKI